MSESKRDVINQEEREDGAPRLLRDVAYERLRDAIRYGKLEPGEPLSEARLSKALEISRTPVREALQQLTQEGLVQTIPGRTLTVAAPSVQEMLDVIHVRLLIEPEIAQLVARSISPESLEAMWEALQEMEDAAEENDRTKWSKADTRLHETLGNACPNELLGQLAIQMHNRIHYQTTDAQTTGVRIVACTQEHQSIVESIAAKDAPAAEEAMREHIKKLQASIIKRLVHSY